MDRQTDRLSDGRVLLVGLTVKKLVSFSDGWKCRLKVSFSFCLWLKVLYLLISTMAETIFLITRKQRSDWKVGEEAGLIGRYFQNNLKVESPRFFVFFLCTRMSVLTSQGLFQQIYTVLQASFCHRHSCLRVGVEAKHCVIKKESLGMKETRMGSSSEWWDAWSVQVRVPESRRCGRSRRRCGRSKLLPVRHLGQNRTEQNNRTLTPHWCWTC